MRRRVTVGAHSPRLFPAHHRIPLKIKFVEILTIGTATRGEIYKNPYITLHGLLLALALERFEALEALGQRGVRVVVRRVSAGS